MTFVGNMNENKIYCIHFIYIHLYNLCFIYHLDSSCRRTDPFWMPYLLMYTNVHLHLKTIYFTCFTVNLKSHKRIWNCCIITFYFNITQKQNIFWIIINSLVTSIFIFAIIHFYLILMISHLSYATILFYDFRRRVLVHLKIK